MLPVVGDMLLQFSRNAVDEFTDHVLDVYIVTGKEETPRGVEIIARSITGCPYRIKEKQLKTKEYAVYDDPGAFRRVMNGFKEMGIR